MVVALLWLIPDRRIASTVSLARWRGNNRSIPLSVILGAAFVTGYGFGWARLRSGRGEAVVAGATAQGDADPDTGARVVVSQTG